MHCYKNNVHKNVYRKTHAKSPIASNKLLCTQLVKGQSNKIFDSSFSIGRNSRGYEFHTGVIHTYTQRRSSRRGIILQRDSLIEILYTGEIDSPEYYTLRRLTRRSILPWGDWLDGVLYPGKIDLPEYCALGRLTCWSIIPWRDWLAGV